MDWLNRFTDVMDCISEHSVEGIGVSELSRRTNLSKSTIHRMLSSMLSKQFVTQNHQTKNYLLGPKALFWGSQFLRSQDPNGLMGKYCEEISGKTGLYSYLCIFHGEQFYCTYTHQPSHLRNKYFVHVGQRMPSYCTAAAKAILAYQQPDCIQTLLAKESYKQFTPFTLTNQEALEWELETVFKEEIAYCHQELEIGVTAISAPIFHKEKKCAMSLSIVGESMLIDSNKETNIQNLKTVAEKASSHLTSMHMLTSIRL
ncbi:MAG: IclR family transcriptional regulator [Bacillus sp. (in: firmicutes)]